MHGWHGVWRTCLKVINFNPLQDAGGAASSSGSDSSPQSVQAGPNKCDEHCKKKTYNNQLCYQLINILMWGTGDCHAPYPSCGKSGGLRVVWDIYSYVHIYIYTFHFGGEIKQSGRQWSGPVLPGLCCFQVLSFFPSPQMPVCQGTEPTPVKPEKTKANWKFMASVFPLKCFWADGILNKILGCWVPEQLTYFIKLLSGSWHIAVCASIQILYGIPTDAKKKQSILESWL
jgi:hypothetical protein